MATDRTQTANYTVGDPHRLTTGSSGTSRTLSFQGLKWYSIPILNIDASASDTFKFGGTTTGIKGIQAVFWEGETSTDICFPQVDVVTGVVTFTGGNSDCDGRLLIAVKA